MKDTDRQDAPPAYVSLWRAEFHEHLGCTSLGMDVKWSLGHQNQENLGPGAQRHRK